MEMLFGKAVNKEAETLVAIYHDAYAENEMLGLPASASRATASEVQRWIDESIVLTAKE